MDKETESVPTHKTESIGKEEETTTTTPEKLKLYSSLILYITKHSTPYYNCFEKKKKKTLPR